MSRVRVVLLVLIGLPLLGADGPAVREEPQHNQSVRAVGLGYSGRRSGVHLQPGADTVNARVTVTFALLRR